MNFKKMMVLKRLWSYDVTLTWYSNILVSPCFKTKLFKEVVISSWVRNLLNQNYISNAWIYRFQAGSYATSDPYVNTEDSSNGRYNKIGAYNQAGINFFLGLKLRF